MVRQDSTQLAVAAFFMAIQKGIGISTALADLYEAGVEAGQSAVVDDPQAHGLVGLPC